MALTDHIAAAAEACVVSIQLTDDPPHSWTVQLRRVSPADLILGGGELWGMFSEQEIVRALSNVKDAAPEERMDKLGELAIRQQARRATEAPHQVRERARQVRRQAIAAVCAAVVAIDTHDGDGAGLEPITLVPDEGAEKPASGDKPPKVWVDRLPPVLVDRLIPHIQRISTDGAQEVAAVMARFCDDPEGAPGAVGEREAAPAGAGGPADAVA